MPFIAAPINLTPVIENILNRYAKSRSIPACQKQRANLIILASAGKSNREISDEISLSQDSVSKWRTRWIKNSEHIINIEQNNPQQLEEAIKACLKDLPRPGCPCDFTEEQILRILEIACRNPSEFGYETSHWSLNQLVKTVIDQGIVEVISPASISRFLKYGRYTPSPRSILAPFIRQTG